MWGQLPLTSMELKVPEPAILLIYTEKNYMYLCSKSNYQVFYSKIIFLNSNNFFTAIIFHRSIQLIKLYKFYTKIWSQSSTWEFWAGIKARSLLKLQFWRSLGELLEVYLRNCIQRWQLHFTRNPLFSGSPLQCNRSATTEAETSRISMYNWTAEWKKSQQKTYLEFLL